MTEIDLDALEAQAKAQLVQCGPCDFGLVEYGCTCPKGDPRPVISQLVELIAEVRKLRAANTELAISNDALAFQANAVNAELVMLRADEEHSNRDIERLNGEVLRAWGEVRHRDKQLDLLEGQRDQVLALLEDHANTWTLPGVAMTTRRFLAVVDAIREIYASNAQPSNLEAQK